jgi:NitT/TauT family transport system substrate-binding protein
MKKILCAMLSIALLWTANATAEIREVVISKQYGLGFLPLIVLEEQHLIEKHARAAGLGEVKTQWATFGGGSVANDALLSGNAHIVGGGVAPFERLWDKTQGKVKALASLNEAPIIFASNNPAVKSVRDLGEKDRIALPSVKVSVQALALQIATAKAFGLKAFDRFDHLTVAMKHPDALVALTGGRSEITGHIGLEPYSTLELEHPKIHAVFNSFEILGPHSTNLIWTTEAFYRENPKLARAIVAALDEADRWIVAHPDQAVQLYLSAYKSKESPELIGKVLKNALTFRTQPLPNITLFSDFLFDTGATKRKPARWQELFFDAVY